MKRLVLDIAAVLVLVLATSVVIAFALSPWVFLLFYTLNGGKF